MVTRAGDKKAALRGLGAQGEALVVNTGVRTLTRLCGLAATCAALSFAGAAAAQNSSSGGDLLNQLLMKALQGAQKQGAPAEGGAQAQQSSGYLDTPENLQKVVAEARNRSAAAAPAPSQDCQRATSQMRPGKIAGTGYLELLAKCEAELEKDMSAQHRVLMQAEKRRAEIQQQRNGDAVKRADDYEAGRVQLMADLKAGSKKLLNHNQN